MNSNQRDVGSDDFQSIPITFEKIVIVRRHDLVFDMRLTIYGQPLRSLAKHHLSDHVRAMFLRVADPRSGAVKPGHGGTSPPVAADKRAAGGECSGCETFVLG
jgi:hypothetical protein